MKARAVFAFTIRFTSGLLAVMVLTVTAQAQTTSSAKPEFPPHASVLSGYDKVVSTTDGKSMYTLWQRKKDNQMYAELPRSFSSKKYFIALTVASGDTYAGLQSGDMYVYWRRFDKRLALIAPNLDYRATGDKHASASVKRLFTDRIVLEVPIVTLGPGGGPVIDLDQMLVGKANVFFGFEFRPNPIYTRYNIFAIKTAKAYPQNVEVAFEAPDTSGDLKTIHYSISEVPSNPAYKARKADERIGYFTTSYSDLAKYDDRETRVRYINRWHLEKANPKLKVSPPKKPIRFYIEHTTPIRYRRWVKQGILSWNKAFEKIGISDAIVVEYQDATTGEHMEKDPEDVRYNFVRWLNNDIGTAIGPSRVHPLTGEILDADIILTDGWIRHYKQQFSEMLPKVAMEGFSPQTLAWLARHPQWDPRIRLAEPSQRNHIRAEIARRATQPYGGHALTAVDPTLIGDDEYDGLIGRHSQVNGLCLAAEGKAFDVAMMKMHLELMAAGGFDEAASELQSAIQGTWQGVARGLSAAKLPADELPIGLRFEVDDDDSLTGFALFLGAEKRLDSTEFDVKTGKFKGTLQPEENLQAVFEATLADGRLSGEWALVGAITAKGTWEATREAAPAPAPAGDSGDDKDGDGEDAEDKEKKDEDKEDEKKDDDKKEEKKDEKKPAKPAGEQMLDGMPESFVGPLIVELVAHEVGHTLGLRHNFKASSIHTLAAINSDDVKGKKTLAGSVMDYLPVNMNMKAGKKQGDYTMLGIGPYDMWAIEYGYTFSSDLKSILARVAEPELAYATDEDTFGPDPLARRYDFSANPLDYANNQMRLAKHHRSRILEHFVKDGDSWSRARQGYELTLSMQTRAISMMANWIGGSFVTRDKKGDKNGRIPVRPVPTKMQREALDFVIENSFRDEAFGLDRNLIQHMTVDKWLDGGFHFGSNDPSWPVHDRIMGIQSSTLTMLMNPSTLEYVYDNEFRMSADDEALTLPELLSKTTAAIWTELDSKPNGGYTARKPMISSLRRNLQREHMERLIDLTMPDGLSNVAGKPIANLARRELKAIVKKIEKAQSQGADKHDAYTDAHLSQAKEQIEEALDADYIYNANSMGGGGFGGFILFGQDGRQTEQPAGE